MLYTLTGYVCHLPPFFISSIEPPRVVEYDGRCRTSPILRLSHFVATPKMATWKGILDSNLGVRWGIGQGGSPVKISPNGCSLHVIVIAWSKCMILEEGNIKRLYFLRLLKAIRGSFKGF